jgi:hypothetical protein
MARAVRERRTAKIIRAAGTPPISALGNLGRGRCSHAGKQFDICTRLAYNEPRVIKEPKGMIHILAGRTQLSLPNCMGYFSATFDGSSAP